MRIGIAFRSVLGLVAAGLSIAGCVEPIELRPDLDAAPTCVAPGGTCSADEICCSGACREGRCEAGACRPAGEPCGSGRQCCTGQCEDGFCLAPSGCSVVGEACAASSECCSGACALSVGGRVVCEPIDGCAPAHELCTEDADCCGGTCEVFDATLGLGHCGVPVGCLPPGELCGDAELGCCGIGGSGRLCRGSVIPDVDRCVTEAARSESLPAGAACASSADCLSGACSPSATGALVCADGCRPEASACGQGIDCCSGRCVSHVCVVVAGGCETLGSRCDDATECCSGLCDAERCAAPF